jgi:hypothetical protein
MQTQTAAKPAYLGLLNAISLGESQAGVHLSAWAGATPDADLAATLRLVAARETSHGQLFERLLCELGYGLRPKPDPKDGKRLAKLADPGVSDLEKIGPERSETNDELGEIEKRIAAGEFDPVSANMLSWWICEERDSGAKLRAAYAACRAKANGHAAKKNGAARANGADAPSADAEAIMACMTSGFAKLEKSIDKLAKAVK